MVIIPIFNCYQFELKNSYYITKTVKPDKFLKGFIFKKQKSAELFEIRHINHKIYVGLIAGLGWDELPD